MDSSEYQRNGDLTPTRLQAQMDAATLVYSPTLPPGPKEGVGVVQVSQCKLRSNAENNVGVIAMTNTVDVLATLTQVQPLLLLLAFGRKVREL